MASRNDEAMWCIAEEERRSHRRSRPTRVHRYFQIDALDTKNTSIGVSFAAERLTAICARFIRDSSVRNCTACWTRSTKNGQKGSTGG